MLVLPSTLPQVLVYVGSGPNSSDKIMSTCDL